MIIPSRRTLALAAALAAAIGGTLVALHYDRLDLTLSHYDARGHLIVARRIFDNLTPGWRQIGAIWLPLPHLLNAVPVQVDALYRSGASAAAISVVSFAAATGAIVWIVAAITGSAAAALAGALVFALNPSVLYLQATPMTEPLLLALALAAIALLLHWCGDRATRRPALVGWLFALACLTRYEAWPIAAAALAAATWAGWRAGDSWSSALRRVGPIALYPALAIVGFMAFSRIVIGEWFVASGFFVPVNEALGRPLVAAGQILDGTARLSGYGLMAAASLGLGSLLFEGLVDRRRAHVLIALAFVAAAALPWLAFLNGHPFRIRYMVPLIVAQAIGAGAVVGLVRRARLPAALALVLLVGVELTPLDRAAPVIVEAQSDRPNAEARRRVTDCLASDYAGELVMASMGSLGHYMQELSHEGFAVRDFLHEGNGETWLRALDGARSFVGWVLIEERAEGGDMLATIAREDPRLLAGFSRACEGGGVALYRRSEADVERQKVVESADVDLGAQEALIGR